MDYQLIKNDSILLNVFYKLYLYRPLPPTPRSSGSSSSPGNGQTSNGSGSPLSSNGVSSSNAPPQPQRNSQHIFKPMVCDLIITYLISLLCL